MVGLDYHWSGGAIYSYRPDSMYVCVDPFFRVGVHVTRNLALGADLALFRTFPRHGDMFPSTPIFAFGPVATWFPSHSNGIQAYATAGTGVAHSFGVYGGWRFRLSVGALFDAGIPVTFGPEIGWFADGMRVPGYAGPPHQAAYWLSGSSFFIGLRLSDLRL
jgi:hypothetical protein